MAKANRKSDARSVDRIAAEFAEVKARKIPTKRLVWMFRIITSRTGQAEPALAACVELLVQELGARCRATLETNQVDDKRMFHDIILKSTKITPALLRRVDRGLAGCARQSRVKYAFVGYGEDVYETTAWKPIGTLLEVHEEAKGEFDCRELRFDGLYRAGDGDDSCDHLRFYPDGHCLFVLAIGSIDEVSRWLRREKKGLTCGTYQVRGARLNAEVRDQARRGEEPTCFKLQGRLTKLGLKVRVWSSYSNAEEDKVFAFYQAKLK